MWGDLGSLGRLQDLTIPNGPTDPDPKSGIVATDIIQQVSIFGPIKIKQYSKLRESLRSMGYRVGVNYVEFPYDWRQSNYTTARQFAKFADENVVLKGHEFDILAHSMGGLVAEIYAKELDQNQRVRRVVNMAVPFAGSVNTLATLTEGWGDPANWIAGGLTTIRRFALAMPSFYELLPNYKNCCILGRPQDAQRVPYNPLLPETWAYVNWIPSETPSVDQQAHVGTALASAERLRTLATKAYPSYIQTYYIVGSSIDTRWQYYVVRGGNGVLHYNMTRGDGTVPEGSASEQPRAEAPSNFQITIPFVSMAQHGSIFDDDAAIETLRHVLSQGTPFPTTYNAKIYSLSTTGGDVLPVSSVGLSVEPAVVVRGDQVTIEFRVTGDAGAPLDKLLIEAVAQNSEGVRTPLQLEPSLDTSSPLVSQGIYRAAVRASDELGPVTVTFSTKGLPTMEDYFTIVNKIVTP
jgi:pimeloyl-ACP methyl ester carboxylesterase